MTDGPNPEAAPAPSAVLLDMDGVLFHGERPLPGAAGFLSALSACPHVFLTNNPILSPGEIVKKFVRIGLPRPDSRMILTSAQATARWLHREKPDFRYYAVGERGLHQALAGLGTEDENAADFVVTGEGAGLDFYSLTRGINLILKNKARLVATNPDQTVDATLNGEHVILPGGGALVAPFAAATGVEPVVIGKPNPLLYEMAVQILGVRAQQCLMIGDRPDTDIAGASRLGMVTAMVRTGRFAVGEPWPESLPVADWDVSSLAQLMKLLRAHYPELLG